MKTIDWDHNVVDYDLEMFPWYERIFSVIQEYAPRCPSIELLHEYFDRTEIVPLRKKVEQFVRTKEFSGWVDDYFHHIGSTLFDLYEDGSFKSTKKTKFFTDFNGKQYKITIEEA